MKTIMTYSALLLAIRNGKHRLIGLLQKAIVGFLASAMGGYAISANTAEQQMSDPEKLIAGWKIPFDGSASSSVLVDGVLYVGSKDGAVYALDSKTGGIKWRFQTGQGLVSGPEIITVRPGASFEEQIAAASRLKPRGKREVDATPVVENGTVFIGSKDYSFYAIDAATGSKKWSFPTAGEIYDKAIVHGDVVLFPSGDGFLYAVDAITGQKRWGFETLAGVPDAIIADGVVYLTTCISTSNQPAKSFLYAIDIASGLAKWTVATDGSLTHLSRWASAIVQKGTPINRNGHIFFLTTEDLFSKKKENSRFVTLHAIDASSGKMKWQFEAEGRSPVLRPSIVVRDMVIFGTDLGLFAVDLETGAPRWSHVGGKYEYGPIYADDRFVYLSTREALHALNPVTGNERWSSASREHLRLGEYVEIVAVRADTIYVDANRYLYCIHRETGKELWSFEAETGHEARLLIADGMVFIPGITEIYHGEAPKQGYFYAIDAKTGRVRP